MKVTIEICQAMRDYIEWERKTFLDKAELREKDGAFNWEPEWTEAVDEFCGHLNDKILRKEEELIKKDAQVSDGEVSE